LQGNPFREPKVEKKGGKTPVRGKATSTNTSNKGGDSHTRNLSQVPNGGNITISTKHRNGVKNKSLSGDKEISKGSRIHLKGVFPSIQRRGQRKEIVRETENLSVLGLKRRGNSIHREIGGDLRENTIEQIHPEQAKWFNPTFIIPQPHQKWRKILDASALNKEIQTIHFKMNGTDQVRDLIRKEDQATSLVLKSAFHNLTVYPPHRRYLAFEAMWKVY
ncbi:MAG: hypothetical protein EZS28_004973, partial [Streblomastix strix]